jgi:type I restriction enzyme M protein
LNAVETAQNALDKLTNEKNNKITAAQEQAEKERQAIEAVEQELITMLQDPDLRKRYFAIADMEELDENEFNLNIPRYVNTFEPEEEIDLKQAIAELKNTLSQETALDKTIDELLKVLK